MAIASHKDIIHPKDEFQVFLVFADQMENWVKDGIWELSVAATCG